MIGSLVMQYHDDVGFYRRVTRMIIFSACQSCQLILNPMPQSIIFNVGEN